MYLFKFVEINSLNYIWISENVTQTVNYSISNSSKIIQ